MKKLKLPWHYVTRFVGTVTLLFGLLGDHTTDRATIIMAGFGILGFDKVARSEGEKDKKGEK